MLILVWLRWRHCTQGNTPDASWIPLSALWLSNKPVLIASGQQRICLVLNRAPRGQWILSEWLSTQFYLNIPREHLEWCNPILDRYFGLSGGESSTPASAMGSEASAVLIGLIETRLPEGWLLPTSGGNIQGGVDKQWQGAQSQELYILPTQYKGLLASEFLKHLMTYSRKNPGMWMYSFISNIFFAS